MTEMELKIKQAQIQMLEWFEDKVRRLESERDSYNIENLWEDLRDEKNLL